MKLRQLIFYTCICLLIACNKTYKTTKDASVKNVDLQKDCMTYILKQDDSLGTIRNHNCEKISLSNTIKTYVNSVNNLNFNNCAPKFEQAFKGHMGAWTKMQQVTDNYPNLRGELHDLFDAIEQSKDSTTFKLLLKNIWETWEVVENAKL